MVIGSAQLRAVALMYVEQRRRKGLTMRGVYSKGDTAADHAIEDLFKVLGDAAAWLTDKEAWT